MLFAKFRCWIAACLIIASCSLHAAAVLHAESIAQGLVETLLVKLNQMGLQVQVSQVSVNPYEHSVLVENVRIRDRLGRSHSIDAITLKNIELNAQGDFVKSLQLEARDAVITLVKLTAENNHFNALHSYLQALGINSGRIGHRQLLIFDYDQESDQLLLTIHGQLHHPADNKAISLVDFRLRSRMANVPDLKQQLSLMGQLDNRAALTLPWTSLALISADLSVQDQGVWEPLMRSAAAQENLSETDYRTQLKQEWQTGIMNWKVLPLPLKQHASDAVSIFVDSPQPAMHVNIDANRQQGNSIMVAMVTSMLSPSVLTQLFAITLEAE